MDACVHRSTRRDSANPGPLIRFEISSGCRAFTTAFSPTRRIRVRLAPQLSSISLYIRLYIYIYILLFISFIIATKVQNIRRIKQITVQASLQIIYFPIQSNLLFFSRIQLLRISVKITVHWNFHLVHNTCNSCSILHFSK